MLNDSAALDRAFQALADPTRRAIVERLAREPASVSELAQPLAMSLPAVMQHLGVLEASGLVRSEKSGRVRTCRIEPEALSLAERWIHDRRTGGKTASTGWGTISPTSPWKDTPMDEPAVKQLKPLRLSHTVHAPPKLVFEAWSTAEHVKRWFPPIGFTVPEARVDIRVGGPFEVLMRSPAGEEHWARGVVKEVSEFDRLVIDFVVEEPNGRALFRAFTEIDFSQAPGGTRVDVTQSYTVLDPEAAWMAEGAPQGWTQTLDKLAEEVHRMQGSVNLEPSVVHAAFTVARTYDAPVERVWRALSDAEAKARWFGGPPGEWKEIERVMDFRVGGAERAKGRWTSGVVSTFDAVYHDIVPDARLVYSYVLHLDDRKISVSLATMELKAEDPGRTTLTVTEQGAFLNGYDDAGSREHGTGFLLDKLGASLGRALAPPGRGRR